LTQLGSDNESLKSCIAYVENGDTCQTVGGIPKQSYVVWKNELCYAQSAISQGVSLSGNLTQIYNGIANVFAFKTDNASLSSAAASDSVISVTKISNLNFITFQYTVIANVITTAGTLLGTLPVELRPLHSRSIIANTLSSASGSSWGVHQLYIFTDGAIKIYGSNNPATLSIIGTYCYPD
jgi:hypothetical protein